MKNIKTLRVPAVRKAANDFARGNSWKVIADALNLTLDLAMTLPELYPDIWDQETDRADRQIERETAAEVKFVLRSLLRSADDKVRCEAAKVLLGLHTENCRNELRAAQIGVNMEDFRDERPCRPNLADLPPVVPFEPMQAIEDRK